MCGINGIFAYGPAAPSVDAAELTRTRDHMAARGPDGFGEWVSDDARIGLGHRRLAIIDLSDAGLQPMANADGSAIVTFNGEIYNYRELRDDLQRAGYVFRTHSDTEVLLHLYAAKGEAMVTDLIGMFALAIWDARRGRLFLARDPYGIKPLYYANTGGTFRFASQVKALLAGGVLSGEIDPGGLVGFHMLGSVPEPLTIVREIAALPAGTWLSVTSGGPSEPVHYHSIAGTFTDGEQAPLHGVCKADRHAVLGEALLASVRRHLVSDVPVGAFLSAGIDSGALVGLMRDAGQTDIETVTLSFSEFRDSANDEAPLAGEVARTYGTRHTTRVVTKSEFEADLPRILAAMDQPSIDGVNSWFVSKAARELGLKVAISGVGGDELLGGYPSFRDIPKWVRWLSVPAVVPHLGTALRRLAVAVSPRRLKLSPKAAGMVEYGGDYAGAWLLRRGLLMPWELESVLDAGTVQEGLARLRPLEFIRGALLPQPASPFARVATLESALYLRNQLLRDTDWTGMAHSLEVRTPLADVALLKAAAALDPPTADQLPKSELAFAPSTPLPKAVTVRRKTGFGVPVGAWLRGAHAGEKISAHDGARDWARYVVETWLPCAPGRTRTGGSKPLEATG